MLLFLGYHFFPNVKQIKTKMQHHVSYFNLFPHHLSFLFKNENVISRPGNVMNINSKGIQWKFNFYNQYFYVKL